jgi:hypothetical protein
MKAFLRSTGPANSKQVSWNSLFPIRGDEVDCKKKHGVYHLSWGGTLEWGEEKAVNLHFFQITTLITSTFGITNDCQGVGSQAI